MESNTLFPKKQGVLIITVVGNEHVAYMKQITRDSSTKAHKQAYVKYNLCLIMCAAYLRYLFANLNLHLPLFSSKSHNKLIMG